MRVELRASRGYPRSVARDGRAPARRDERASDSPLVERITRSVYEADAEEWSTPDGCWDIVVIQRAQGTMVLQTGLTSKPVQLRSSPGDTYVTISFKPGVFMPRTPGSSMVDRGLVRPATSTRSFAVDGETLEIPTFDNAEGLVDRLVRRGLLARDALVESVVQGRPMAATPRSVQRHFLLALGMTPRQFGQIRRARQALDRLEAGQPIAAIAADLGYSDQPHMTRSLKAIMGRTPGEIVRARR